MWTYVTRLFLFIHVSLQVVATSPYPSQCRSDTQPHRQVLGRRAILKNDCSEEERDYLQPMISDIAEVLRHAAHAALPLSRLSSQYQVEKFFEFFGSSSYRARMGARRRLDEAARAARGEPNGDVQIYCHAERFPEEERVCGEGDTFYKLYTLERLNEIALCPGWWNSLPEYTETTDPNDQISTLMLHLLINVPYRQTVSRDAYWASHRGFPLWGSFTTYYLQPLDRREASLAQGRASMMLPADRRPIRGARYSPARLEYMYFARSLYRRDAVGPYRQHDEPFWPNWVWLNGTEMDEYPRVGN